MTRLRDVTEALAKELAFDKEAIQNQLRSRDRIQPPPTQKIKASRDPFSRKNFDFQVFRIKFILREPTRDSLFAQLKDCNARLQQLVTSSDKLRAMNGTGQLSTGSGAVELALKKIWKSSDLLFRALQHAWQCSCSDSHVANLRIERHTAKDICFELILMFDSHFEQCDSTSWSWQEVQCGYMPHCVHPYDVTDSPVAPVHHQYATNAGKLAVSDNVNALVPKRPGIRFADAPITIRLCQGLVEDIQKDCMGVIAHENVSYQLHPFIQRKQNATPTRVTLDRVLSDDWKTRINQPQRFKIAHLVASAVAQFSFSPWMRSKLDKHGIVFFIEGVDGVDIEPYEPFIHQAFHDTGETQDPGEALDLTIPLLGILLVELCFGLRLEDSPIRKKHPAGDPESKLYIDLIVAREWAMGVWGEAGEDYSNAVQWCLNRAGHLNNKNWRSEIHGNVIRPLELCLAYFKMTGVTGS